MPIAFGSATTATANNVASNSLAVPSGTADGDMLLIGICVSESAGVAVSAPGFTLKASHNGVQDGGAYNHDVTTALLWRRASSEPASYTVSNDGTYGKYAAMAMLRYTGVIATGDPFRTSATVSRTNAITNSATSVALTGVQASDMALHLAGLCLGSWTGTDFDPAGPGGSWVERGEVVATTTISTPAVLFTEQLGTGTAPAFTATGTTNLGWVFAAGALMEEPSGAGASKIHSTAVRRASTW